MFAHFCTYCAHTTFFVDFALVPSHALGASTSRAATLFGERVLFQALRYWKILFSPSDFEPTSVRNCQFLTLPVRNCQHADPYQVLGLEQSEQQCVLDTRRHQPAPTRYWGTEQPTRRFFKYKLFSLHQVCRKPCLQQGMGFSISSKAFQPEGLNWTLCPVPVFHRFHAVHAF